jgi:2-polyprenyl-6-hydroxyphenyl methylase/3-demethylubiquinone-9 3-methyltransferase
MVAEHVTDIMAGARLRYPETHWAREAPSDDLVDRFVDGYRNVYSRTKVDLFERALGATLAGRRVLDYGGGAGFMAVLCAEKGAQVTLVDAEPNALATARLLAGRRGVRERLETICAEQFPTELHRRRFDVIILKDVIEHIADDHELLVHLARCQEPGGRLLLSTQNRWSFNYFLEGTYQRWWHGNTRWCGWDPTHLRFYTPVTLKRHLNRAGYRPRQWHGLYVVPYNILSWLTLLKRDIVLESLHKFDLWFGSVFPFNRCGWNVVLAAERQGDLTSAAGDRV